MADSSVEKVRRRRASSRKTRSGCRTCKIRHKRCDEAKPVCQNCQRTGRICDGYVDATTGQQFGGHHARLSFLATNQPLARDPSLILLKDQDQAQGFYFFETGTVRQLWAALGDTSWTQPILQVGHHNPAVRHALIALGIMCKRFEISETLTNSTVEATRLHHTAVEQRGKALFHLISQHRTEIRGQKSSEDTIVCFMTLALFELLRGSEGDTLNHLRNAVSLAETVAPGTLRPCFLYLLTMMDMVTAHWLTLHRAQLKSSLQFQQLYTGPAPQCGFDLEALSNEFLDLQHDIMTFRHAAAVRQLREPGSDMDRDTAITTLAHTVAVKETIQSRLRLWHDALLRAGTQDKENAAYRRAVLRANYLKAMLMLDAVHIGQSTGEQSVQICDVGRQHGIEQYREILSLAEMVLGAGLTIGRYDPCYEAERWMPTGLLPIVSFRISFIHPLFFTAQNAPKTSLRRRAIQVLLERPWREGGWDSAAMGLIAKRSLESQGVSTI